MKSFCSFCGAELHEEARFCSKCGKPVVRNAEQPQPVQQEVPVAPQPRADVRQTAANAPARKNSTVLETMRSLTERYILRGITLLACLIVFISGFFINISFMPMEQVQAKISVNSSGSTVDLDGILSTMSYDQNIFNVFGAFAVPMGGSVEEQEKIQEALDARQTEIIAKYGLEIARLTAQIEQGNNARAVDQLIYLLERIAHDLERSVRDINLIKMDRLEAELAYGNSYGDLVNSEAGGTVSENVMKQADDALARTIIMAGYPVGVIYLQVVALVFLIITAVSMFRGRIKLYGGKFFNMYLIGFVFLFLISQLSATSIGGTGMFCFVFASALFLLYLMGKVFITRGMNAQRIVSIMANGVASVLSFAALCALFGAAFEFGGLVDKVGSVFGLHVFGNTNLVSGEGVAITASNMGVYGGVYLILLVLASLVFFRSVVQLANGRQWATSDIVLTSIVCAIAFIGYIVFYILAEVMVLELLYAPAAFIAVGMLSLCSIAVRTVSAPLSRTVSKDRGAVSPYSNYSAPYMQSAAPAPAYAASPSVAMPSEQAAVNATEEEKIAEESAISAEPEEKDDSAKNSSDASEGEEKTE